MVSPTVIVELEASLVIFDSSEEGSLIGIDVMEKAIALLVFLRLNFGHKWSNRTAKDIIFYNTVDRRADFR